MYNWVDDVLNGEAVLLPTQFEVNDCELLKGKRAIHFSHASMTEREHWRRFVQGNVDETTNTANYRPAVVFHWFENWKEVCGNQSMSKSVFKKKSYSCYFSKYSYK